MVELKHFGWNALTLSFLATTFFALLGGWSLVKQLRAVHRERSGQSLSVVWLAFFAASMAAGLPYGLEKQSLAMILHFALRMPQMVCLLIVLRRHRPFTGPENLLFLGLALGLAWMSVSDNRAPFFAFFTGAGVVGLMAQPREIWRQKSVGVVTIDILLVGLVAALFWLVYALAISDPTLFAITSLYVLVYIITLWLYFRYRVRP